MAGEMGLRSAVPVIAILVIVTAVSFAAQANPRPVDRPSTMGLGAFFAILFSVNFFLNLFWYSLFLLMALAWKGTGAARIGPGRARFHGAILGSAVILTLTGVSIDYLFLYEEHQGWLYFIYDGGRWAAAALLVGLSVFVFSHLIMKMRPRYCLLPAAGMVAMNLLWWGLLDRAIPDIWCTPVLFLVLVPLVLYELDKWHRREFGKAGGPSGIAGHPDGV